MVCYIGFGYNTTFVKEKIQILTLGQPEMEYLKLNKSAQALTTELKKHGLGTLAQDMDSNLFKLSQYSIKNMGTDLNDMVQKFKPLPLDQEHPYCWLVWLARGCHFMFRSCQLNEQTSLLPSQAIKKAYEETLYNHHSMIAAGVSKASFVLLQQTLDGSTIDWSNIKKHATHILQICDQHQIVYL